MTRLAGELTCANLGCYYNNRPGTLEISCFKICNKAKQLIKEFFKFPIFGKQFLGRPTNWVVYKNIVYSFSEVLYSAYMAEEIGFHNTESLSNVCGHQWLCYPL